MASRIGIIVSACSLERYKRLCSVLDRELDAIAVASNISTPASGISQLFNTRFVLSSIVFAALAFAPCALAQMREPADSGSLSSLNKGSGTTARVNGGLDALLSPKSIRVDVNLVLVPVTVSDSMNRPIVDLEKEQFAIYEDNKLQQVRFFSKEDTPLSIGLILDVSNSMANKIDMEREAVGSFFRGSNPQDEHFVITFSDRPKLLAGSAESIGTIQGKLSTTKPAGYTALLDSIYLGLNRLQSAQYQRRALVIISDGGDNNSRYKAREIRGIVEESDVQIYAIRAFDAVPLFRTIEEKMGNKLLTEITEVSGGRTISVNNAARIPEAMAAINRDLRNQYVLGYRSSSRGNEGKWRKIKVRVSAPAHRSPLRVDYKKGYFAAR